MKIIVAGSRQFTDYELMKEKLNRYLKGLPEPITIVSGTAKGADKLGEQYAAEMGYSVDQYPADWDTYGKSAGYRRNEDMAKIADACIVFWDGESRGSKHMIDIAEREGLPLRIVKF